MRTMYTAMPRRLSNGGGAAGGAAAAPACCGRTPRPRAFCSWRRVFSRSNGYVAASEIVAATQASAQRPPNVVPDAAPRGSAMYCFAFDFSPPRPARARALLGQHARRALPGCRWCAPSPRRTSFQLCRRARVPCAAKLRRDFELVVEGPVALAPQHHPSRPGALCAGGAGLMSLRVNE